MLRSSFLLPDPFSIASRCTPSHPQLRDLMTCVAEDSDAVVVACWDSLANHDLLGNKESTYTSLGFAPCCLTSNLNLIIAGGQNGELAMKSTSAKSNWCYQTDATSNSNINNSISISVSPLSQQVPRILVSNNDESVKVYEVKGRIPDFNSSKRKRIKEYERGGSRSFRKEDDEEDSTMKVDNNEAFEEGDNSEVEEEGVYDEGGECKLVNLAGSNINLHTAVNHSSVSPDGRKVVVVGDSNEIFLFDVLHNGNYDLVHVFEGSDDASFSSDWSGNGNVFAVGSQDGFVHIYDIRNLPPPTGTSRRKPNKVATLKSSQSGPSGAIRKVKFSANNVNSELLAFTEHQSVVQVVCARSFDKEQVIQVPNPQVNNLKPRSIPSNFNFSNSKFKKARSIRSYNNNATASTSRATPTRAWTTNEMLARMDTAESNNEANTNSTDPRIRNNNNNNMTHIWRFNNEEQDLEQQAREEASLAPLVGLMARQGMELPLTGEERARSDFERRRLIRILTTSSTNNSNSNNNGSRNNARRRIVDSSDEEDEDDEEVEQINIDQVDSEDEDVDEDEDDEEQQDEEDEDCPSPLLLPVSNPTRPLIPPTISPPILSGYSPLNFTRLPPMPPSDNYSNRSYITNSAFFPLEIRTAKDNLGLDWSEFGERLCVATEGRIWEWEVDGKGRRSFSGFDLI